MSRTVEFGSAPPICSDSADCCQEEDDWKNPDPGSGSLNRSVPVESGNKFVLEAFANAEHLLESQNFEPYLMADIPVESALRRSGSASFGLASSETYRRSRPSGSQLSSGTLVGLTSTKFSDDAEMRGVSLTKLLRRFGSLLDASKEPGAHLKASHVMGKDKLDYFITHSWSERCWRKFLALAMAFHGLRALLVSVAVQLVCYVLVAAGVLPLSSITVNGTEMLQAFSMWCMLAGSISFWITLLFTEDVLSLAGFSHYHAFYDAACIDQTSNRAKRQGIGSITAYLSHSETLLVLLSRGSLKRIWTVFELTAFLAMKPYDKVVVHPVALAVAIAGAGFTSLFLRLTYTVMVSSWTAWNVSKESASLAVAAVSGTLSFFLLLCILALLRVWGRSLSELGDQIQEFNFADAQCSVEADRKDILDAALHLAEELQLVEQCARPEEACSALEVRAKRVVPEFLHGSLSMSGMSFRNLLLVVLPRLMGILDRSAAELQLRFRDSQTLDGAPFLHLLQQGGVVLATFTNTIAVFLIILLLLRRRHRGCLAEACLLCLATLLSLVGTVPISLWLRGFGAPTQEHALLLSFLIVVQSAFCWVSYCRPCWPGW